MKQLVMVLSLMLTLFTVSALAQEILIPNFPLDKGMWVEASFWTPYETELNLVADTICLDSNLAVYIYASADGETHRRNHDPKNAGDALSRAHAIKYQLVQRGVDSTRIFIQTGESLLKGGQYRCVLVTVKSRPATMDDLENWGQQLIAQLPTAPPCTTIVEKTTVEKAGGVLSRLTWTGGLGQSWGEHGNLQFARGGLAYDHLIGIEAWYGRSLLDEGSGRYYGIPSETYYHGHGVNVTIQLFKASTPLHGWLIAGQQQLEQVPREFRRHTDRYVEAVIGLRANYDFKLLRYVTVDLLYTNGWHRNYLRTLAEGTNGLRINMVFTTEL